MRAMILFADHLEIDLRFALRHIASLILSCATPPSTPTATAAGDKYVHMRVDRRIYSFVKAAPPQSACAKLYRSKRKGIGRVIGQFLDISVYAPKLA